MTELRETDSKGRMTLPRGFANATLLVDIVSDVELRIRKAKVVPMEATYESIHFTDEAAIELSAEAYDQLLAALDSPQLPSDALKKLVGEK